MIKNQRQYHITKTEAERFRGALQTLRDQDHDETHPRLRMTQEAAIASQLADLEADIEAYEALGAEMGQQPIASAGDEGGPSS